MSGRHTKQMVLDIANLGQVFTPDRVVKDMVNLRMNKGTILEPSAGDGAFMGIPGIVGIDIDGRLAGRKVRHMDFFDLPTTRKFDTIIGNPPYVRYQDIRPSTKVKLHNKFDRRTNLYIFFIDKCLDHLASGGELIFITPRDFIKTTNAVKLNQRLYDEGTITHFDDLGDAHVFDGATPNCAIWRFEKDNMTHRLDDGRYFRLEAGNIVFSRKTGKGGVPVSDLFEVKVGAVSGLDEAFVCNTHGRNFVCSKTKATGRYRNMVFNKACKCIRKNKGKLLKRRIKKFTESNWYEWGRAHCIRNGKRIYVNTKTRDPHPFFVSDVEDYDGSILALFPHRRINLNKACSMLNEVDWDDSGFVCDGRFIFSQKSLESAILPKVFRRFLL